MTKSTRGASGPVNMSHDLQCSAETSWPSARSLASTSGIGASAGADPAEYARKRSPPTRARIASAMIERAEFRVHRNSTLKAGVMAVLSSGIGGSSRARSPHSSGRPAQQDSVRNASSSRSATNRTA